MRHNNPILSRGFTIAELMMVLAITAILAALILPGYKDSVTKSRRADAEAALLGLANAMQRHYTVNSTYLGAAGTKAAPADTGSPWIFPSEVPIDSKGTKYYDLSIESATATTYLLQATPKGSQADDGLLQIDHTGTKGWDRNNNGAIGANEHCWEKGC